MKCYDPQTEQCCKNGACYKNQTCCTNECCNSIAYCGADGFCKPCPADVRTRVSISTYTSTTVVTSTVTELVQRENGPGGFSCKPETVTNDLSETLVLDFDCSLSYEPPTPPSSSAAEVKREEKQLPSVTGFMAPNLLARQLSCAPYTTQTTTLFSTVSTTTKSTTTTTTTVAPVSEGFHCVEMTATNAFGDELILDEECSFSYQPGGASGTATQGGGGKKSGAASLRHSLAAVMFGLATVLIYYI